MDDRALIKAAFEAMRMAYAPYSRHKVGAALLLGNGEVVTGCNIENAAYGPTVCAERTAIFKAVSEGRSDFVKIAVVGGKDGKVENYSFPCGVCRQVMAEFCAPDFEIITAKSEDDYVVCKLSELLPHSFGAANLDGGGEEK